MIRTRFRVMVDIDPQAWQNNNLGSASVSAIGGA